MLSTTRPTYRSRRGIPHSSDDGLSLLEQFLRMANHELRSPLTAVRVQSQLGRRYLERGDTQRVAASLHTIEEQSFHMERMLKDLLDAAKIPQGHFTVRLVQANLVRLCEQSISTLRAITGREILAQLPKNALPILADPDALQRMFGHLLLNAALYSPANSPIEVTVALEAADRKGRSQRVLVSVRDEGTGIATEELTTIFEQFYRGNAGREAETSGLGLGLALCKEIAHRHGGEIWVTSQCPGGSTFFVMLPVSKESKTDAHKGPHAASAQPPSLRYDDAAFGMTHDANYSMLVAVVDAARLFSAGLRISQPTIAAAKHSIPPIKNEIGVPKSTARPPASRFPSGMPPEYTSRYTLIALPRR